MMMRKLMRGVVGSLGLVATLIIGVLVPLAPAAAQNDRRVDIGVTAGPDASGRVAGIEAEAGERVDIVRVFKRITDQFPNRQERRLLADGYELIISIDSSTADGDVPWRAIAEAEPGSFLHGELTRWVESVRPWADRVHLSFQHEPESRINVDRGGAGDFIAAWRAVMGMFDAAGVQTKGRVWTMTSFSFRVDGGDRRAAGRWYPGDAWVDAFAAAAYNWGGCRPGFNDEWRSFADSVEAFRQFGARSPDKDLMVAELGSTEDRNQPGRKAAWIRDVAAVLSSPGYEQFSTIVWFDARHDNRDGVNSCDWRLRSSDSVMPAFGDLMRALRGGAAAEPARPAPPVTTTTTVARTTAPPSTVPPSTVPPSTVAPATTAVPITVPPTTVAPATTAVTTTAPPATVPSTTRVGPTTTTTRAPAAIGPTSNPPRQAERASGALIGGGALDGAGSRHEFELVSSSSGLHRLGLELDGRVDVGMSVRGVHGHFVVAAAPGERSIMVELTAGEPRRLAVWSREGSGSFEVRLASPSPTTTIRSGRADVAGDAGAAHQHLAWTADRSGSVRFVLDWSSSADLSLRVGAEGTMLGEDVSGSDLALVEATVVEGRRYEIEIWATAGASSFQLTVADN